MIALKCVAVARAALGEPAKKAGAEVFWLCPRHDDTKPSLQVNERKNTWACFPCNASGTAWQLAAWLVNADPADKPAVLRYLKEKGLVQENVPAPVKRQTVAQFSYRDEGGKVIYQTVRFEPKGFAYRRPAADGKSWIWNLDGVRLVPYRLPDLVKAAEVFIVEGEKDADALAAWDLCATTNPMGAGKWRAEYNPHFAGKHVVVLPDADEPGEKHAQQVAAHLLAVAATVRILKLPGLPPKGDFSVWKAAGGTARQLLELAVSAPLLEKAEMPGGSFAILREVPGLSGIPNMAVTWLVDSFLPEGGLVIVAGMKASLKSWLALDLAGRVAEGLPFAGRRTKRATVLYLDRENPAAVLNTRREVLGLGDPAALRYWGTWATEQPCAITDDRLRAFAGEARPLLIFDSLVRFTGGREENSAEQMALITAAFRELTARGATVLVIAHKSDKPGASPYRGSSEILAGCDVAWGVERQESDRRAVRLHCLKNRFAEEREFYLRLEPGGFVNARPGLLPGTGAAVFTKRATEAGVQ